MCKTLRVEGDDFISPHLLLLHFSIACHVLHLISKHPLCRTHFGSEWMAWPKFVLQTNGICIRRVLSSTSYSPPKEVYLQCHPPYTSVDWSNMFSFFFILGLPWSHAHRHLNNYNLPEWTDSFFTRSPFLMTLIDRTFLSTIYARSWRWRIPWWLEFECPFFFRKSPPLRFNSFCRSSPRGAFTFFNSSSRPGRGSEAE